MVCAFEMLRNRYYEAAIVIEDRFMKFYEVYHIVVLFCTELLVWLYGIGFVH